MITLPTYYYARNDYSDLHRVISSKFEGHELKLETEFYSGKPIVLCPLEYDLKDELHDYLLNFSGEGFVFDYDYMKETEGFLIDKGLDPILLRLEDWIRIKVPYSPFEHFVYLPKGWLV